MPPEGDERFVQWWQEEVWKDVKGISPALRGIEKDLDRISRELATNTNSTKAVHERLDEAAGQLKIALENSEKEWRAAHEWTERQVNYARAFLAGFLLVSGLVSWFAKEQYDDIQVSKQKLAKIEAAPDSYTYLAGKVKEQTGLINDMRAQIDATDKKRVSQIEVISTKLSELQKSIKTHPTKLTVENKIITPNTLVPRPTSPTSTYDKSLHH